VLKKKTQVVPALTLIHPGLYKRWETEHHRAKQAYHLMTQPEDVDYSSLSVKVRESTQLPNDKLFH
jgi:hypothetical protein